MGALPKKKTSRARQGERRSHLHISLAALNVCPHCRRPRLSHRACRACGYYKGTQMLKIKETKS